MSVSPKNKIFFRKSKNNYKNNYKNNTLIINVLKTKKSKALKNKSNIVAQFKMER